MCFHTLTFLHSRFSLSSFSHFLSSVISLNTPVVSLFIIFSLLFKSQFCFLLSLFILEACCFQKTKQKIKQKKKTNTLGLSVFLSGWHMTCVPQQHASFGTARIRESQHFAVCSLLVGGSLINKCECVELRGADEKEI